MIEHHEDTLIGAAGARIYWQSWIPDSPHGSIVLAHGLAEHSGRYAHVAIRLAEAGFAVYALDHRGHGKSTGERADLEQMAYVRADLDQLIAIAQEASTPVFLLGHSLGGLIALDYLCADDGTAPHRGAVTGLVLSGAATDPSVITGVQRVVVKVLAKVLPTLGVVALDAGAVSRDPEQVRRYRTDPYNFTGKICARTGAETFAAVDRVTVGLSRITIPALILHGGDDQLASPAGSKLVARGLAGPTELTIYPGLYHEIFNEPEKDAVLDDVVAWLTARREEVSA